MKDRPIGWTTTVLCFALITCASLPGCGGSIGGGSTGGGNGATLTIETSERVIDYGQSLNVAWEGKLMDRMGFEYGQTNFRIGQRQFSGSFSDRPASDSTYTVIAFRKSGGGMTAEATVRVRKSLKSFLVVGDPVDPDVIRAVASLKKVTARAITVRSTFGPALNADVVVLFPSGSFGPLDQPKIVSHLTSGKSVMLCTDAPRKLATGKQDQIDFDITPIGSWFAGGKKCFLRLDSNLIVALTASIPISEIYRGDDLPSSLTINPVAKDAEVLCSDNVGGAVAFGYRPAIGGKVAYLGHALVDSPAVPALAVEGLFLAECRWLADGH